MNRVWLGRARRDGERWMKTENLFSAYRPMGGNHFISMSTLVDHALWVDETDTKNLADTSDWPPIARRTKR